MSTALRSAMEDFALAPPPEFLTISRTEVRQFLNNYAAPRGYAVNWKGGGGGGKTKPTRKRITRYMRCHKASSGCRMRVAFKHEPKNDFGTINVVYAYHNHQPDNGVIGIDFRASRYMLNTEKSHSDVQQQQPLGSNDTLVPRPQNIIFQTDPRSSLTLSTPPSTKQNELCCESPQFWLPSWDMMDEEDFMDSFRDDTLSSTTTSDIDDSFQQWHADCQQKEEEALQQTVDTQLHRELHLSDWIDRGYPSILTLSPTSLRKRFVQDQALLEDWLRTMRDSPIVKHILTGRIGSTKLYRDQFALNTEGVGDIGFGYFGPRGASVIRAYLAETASQKFIEAIQSSPMYAREPYFHLIGILELVMLIVVAEWFVLCIQKDLGLSTKRQAYLEMQHSTDLGTFFCGQEFEDESDEA